MRPTVRFIAAAPLLIAGHYMSWSQAPAPAASASAVPADTFRLEDMQHLSAWLQLFIADRPVIDKTGLASPYDFTLRWMPDAAQAAAFGARAPDPDDPNGLPSLYTAMEEQLGLKLQPEKIPLEVLALDRVERPTPD